MLTALAENILLHTVTVNEFVSVSSTLHIRNLGAFGNFKQGTHIMK